MPLLLVLLVSGGSYCLFIDDLVNMTSLSDPMFSPCFLKLSAFPVCFQANPEQNKPKNVVRPDAVPSRCCASGCCAVQVLCVRMLCSPGVCVSRCLCVRMLCSPGVCASRCLCVRMLCVRMLCRPLRRTPTTSHATRCRYTSKERTVRSWRQRVPPLHLLPAKICSGFVFFLMKVPTRNRNTMEK